MRPPVPIHTERLVLRTAEPGDFDALFSYWSDPDVARYLPFEPTDRAAALKRLGRYLGAVDPTTTDEALFLMVEHDGTIIGDVMLRLKAGDPPAVAELGWVLHPAHQGQGFATEAATAMVELAFGHYDCHRVQAQLDPRNAASVALCLRLGMREEGYLRLDYQFEGSGEWGDTGLYGLLREEWADRA